mgnify:FL=1
MPRYGMATGRVKLVKPRQAKPRAGRAQPIPKPRKVKMTKAPKRTVRAMSGRPARPARPMKPKGRIVQARRVKQAKRRLRSYKQQALRSAGRPPRPYEQAQYDPGMQPTSMDDYIRANQLDEAVWQLTREDPYYDAPYMEDDDLA